jgi:hypothetical protein
MRWGMTDRRTPDATLIEAVRILSRTIHTDDGVIPACLAEVAARIEELVDERRSISTLLQKVQSLEAKIARLREQRRWISVGERLPEDNVAVLCWVDGCGAEMVWREKGQWFMSFAGYPISDLAYTHWQPLPPGPEGYA